MADFLRYYGHLAARFFCEWYRARRYEVFSTLGIAVITFAITYQHDISARETLWVTVKACGIWLILFGLFHLIRTPWKVDRELRAKLQHQASQKEIKERIETLTQLIDQGQQFMRRCRSEKDLVSQDEVGMWYRQVVAVVEAIFDKTYISRLESSVGMPSGMAYWPNLENRHVDGFVNVRVYRLQQFIDELRERLKKAD
jgi:hypothetical protein